MANIKNNAAAQETRRRLIEAAGVVFAAKGLERATIAEITKRAGVALAAVNYHFSDKRELYVEVVRHAHLASLDAVGLDEPQPRSPAERLRLFVARLLCHWFDPNRPAWHGQLLGRELLEPTAVDEVLEEGVCPFAEHLGAILDDLAGHPIPRPQRTLLVCSILGQCMFYIHGQPILKRSYPELLPVAARVDELAAHITQVMLAAVAASGRPESKAAKAGALPKVVSSKRGGAKAAFPQVVTPHV